MTLLVAWNIYTVYMSEILKMGNKCFMANSKNIFIVDVAFRTENKAVGVGAWGDRSFNQTLEDPGS